jgi:PAS domain S-box-containing protein
MEGISIPGEDGHGKRIRAVMIDITKRKETEKAVTESEDRYRIAIEHSNDGVAIVRGDNFVFVNKRFLEIFGYERVEEVVEKPISLTVHPDDRKRVVENNRGRQKNKSVPSIYEMKGMKKNGGTVCVEVSATNIPFRGEPASLAYLRDITSRKQREKELAEDVEKIAQAKQEWESLVDSLSELVLLLDENGDIIRSNRGTESWNFWHPGDVIGQTPHDVLHPYCTKFDCYLKDFISKGLQDSSAGKPLELEVKDEALKRHLDIRMRPIRTQQNGTHQTNGSFAVLVVHDITARRQAQESLTEAYEELKETQQELIRIEKLALLGKFSSGIAHEIRNPLANICASAQFCIAKYELDEEIKRHLRIMLRNSEHANKIIKDLIDLAKPSEVSLEPGDISDLIKSVCNLVKTRCEKQHIHLHTKVSRRLPHILMDKERIEKALLNFILNAVEAMPKGGKLAVNAYPHFDKGQVTISILDTGKGIPQENFDKIFHPFFTTKRTGIGLGLCLADQVISSHKGRLSINSTVGEGTEITIKLPISRES